MSVAQGLASGNAAVAQATLILSISPANGRCSATKLSTHGFTTKSFPQEKSCRVRRSCSNYKIRAVNAPTDGNISGDNQIKGEQEGSLLERRQILAAGILPSRFILFLLDCSAAIRFLWIFTITQSKIWYESVQVRALIYFTTNVFWTIHHLRLLSKIYPLVVNVSSMETEQSL